MSYIVYILRFSNNHLYIGQTNNLDFRIRQHLASTSKSAKFAKDNGSFVLVYTEHFDSRAEAMQREKQLKKWTRAKKEALIAGDLKLLKEL